MTNNKPKRDPFQHLIDDYRDPVPRKLPPVEKMKIKEKPDQDSVLNIRSDDGVWDRLRELKMLKRNQHTNYHSLRNRQRSILLNLPILNARERRRKLMHEIHWIPAELMEDQKFFASSIMNYLIGAQEVVLKDLPDEIKETKHLRNSPKMLKILATILQQLNLYIDKGEMEKFLTLLLRSGYYFEEEGKDWWWLAKEFYNFAKEMTEDIADDYGYSSAVINYVFGKFLLLKVKEPLKAVRCLTKARMLSKKKNWNVEWLTEIEEESIYKNSTCMCYLGLLLEAESLYYENPIRAMIITEEAMKIASECKWDKEYNEAQLEYAIFAFHANKLPEAASKLYDLNKQYNQKEHLHMYICVTLLLAEYFVRINKFEDALVKLMVLVKKAIRYNLCWLRALAYRFIGQIFLLQNNVKRAIKYLKGAARMYHRNDEEHELAKCEYLLGCAYNKIIKD